MMWYGNGVDGWAIALAMIDNVLLWALIILGLTALVRHMPRGDRTVAVTSARYIPEDRRTPEELLAERFARGEIDEQEYRSRLDTLTNKYRPHVQS